MFICFNGMNGPQIPLSLGYIGIPLGFHWDSIGTNWNSIEIGIPRSPSPLWGYSVECQVLPVRCGGIVLSDSVSRVQARSEAR